MQNSMLPRIAQHLLLLLFPAFPLLAENEAETPTQVGPPAPIDVDVVESLEALKAVRDSLSFVKRELETAQERLPEASEAEALVISAEIKALVERQGALEADFEAIATGIDPETYERTLEDEFILTNELDALLEPIIEELKLLTEKPREIEELRSDLNRWKSRLETTNSALENLSDLADAVTNEELAQTITATEALWERRRDQAENRMQAISYQLEQAERSQPSFFETARDGFRSFYKSRGRNFVLCILAFFLTFFGLRYLHQRIDRHFPWKKKEKRPFYLRLIDVGLNLISVLGAVAASLITLYATGDWVLMGLAIIILIGVALAAKNALPKFYDQGRLLLNLGEIREGERVIYHGIPWRVERLSFYSILENPTLRGGNLRLPVNQLSGLISRPTSEEGELWFPCEEGDWILLPDEVHCRVVAQTPEYVQVVKLGGSKMMIPTSDFLSLSTENLSQGFRVSSRFGIDYELQQDSTSSIPETMWAFLTQKIYALIEDREKLVSLKVEFAYAGASSLDLEIIADFDGEMAPKYQVLQRALQRFAVESCNENGWNIPFSQITLHNAFPREEESVEGKKENTGEDTPA
ncbi:MAG: hypothetical protein AAF733_00730 [Verrucomicrobiota bacterium]